MTKSYDMIKEAISLTGLLKKIPAGMKDISPAAAIAGGAGIGAGLGVLSDISKDKFPQVATPMKMLNVGLGAGLGSKLGHSLFGGRPTVGGLTGGLAGALLGAYLNKQYERELLGDFLGSRVPGQNVPLI